MDLTERGDVLSCEPGEPRGDNIVKSLREWESLRFNSAEKDLMTQLQAATARVDSLVAGEEEEACAPRGAGKAEGAGEGNHPSLDATVSSVPLSRLSHVAELPDADAAGPEGGTGVDQRRQRMQVRRWVRRHHRQ